jgi:hypothetical protein
MSMRGGLGVAPDKMDKTIPIEPESGDVLVVDEVLTLDVEFIVLRTNFSE